MHKLGAAGWLKAVIVLTKVQLIVLLKAKLMLELLFRGLQKPEELSTEKSISWVRWRVSKTYSEKRTTARLWCGDNFNWHFVLESCYFINLLQERALHSNSSIIAAQGCGRWVGGGLCVILVWVFAFWVPENHKGGALCHRSRSHKHIFRWLKSSIKFWVCKNSSVLFSCLSACPD